MIILMHPKYQDLLTKCGLRELVTEGRVPDGARVFFDPNLPEEDGEGNPILCFSVSAKEIHYWSGEPIKLPTERDNG